MSNSTSTTVTAQEIADAIQEFETYRERLVTEATTATKKAKLSKSKLEARLAPELSKIDAALKGLRHQYTMLEGK